MSTEFFSLTSMSPNQWGLTMHMQDQKQGYEWLPYFQLIYRRGSESNRTVCKANRDQATGLAKAYYSKIIEGYAADDEIKVLCEMCQLCLKKLGSDLLIMSKIEVEIPLFLAALKDCADKQSQAYKFMHILVGEAINREMLGKILKSGLLPKNAKICKTSLFK